MARSTSPARSARAPPSGSTCPRWPEPMIEKLNQQKLNGPTALRALARAFANFGDFDRFVAGLQSALEHSSLFERTTIMLDKTLADGVKPFAAGVMNLPLSGGALRHGVLQAAPGGEPRQFGAED